MHKQFVTHQIAEDLKKLGFDENCFGWYDDKKSFFFPANNTMHTRNSRVNNVTLIAAPLWQQVIDWLDTKNLFSVIYRLKNSKYECQLHNECGVLVSDDLFGEQFSTRQEALEATILTALKTIK